MRKKPPHTEIYVTSIIQDIRTRFVSEETTKHTAGEIERIYEFEDGAVVKYEWRSAEKRGRKPEFNHRISIVKPPRPNPHKIRKGVIKVLSHPDSGRQRS